MLQRYAIGPAASSTGALRPHREVHRRQRAGRPVRAAFGTSPPGAEALTSPDSINVANTSVVQHGAS
jgi:carotenoid cleavage dioxygenase